MLKLIPPTILRIDVSEDKIKWLKPSLEYTDKKIDFEIQRYKKNAKWWSYKLGLEKFEETLAKLKEKRKQSLLFKDENGYYTYSGLVDLVSNLVKEPVVNEVEYPEPESIPWSKKPPELRYYQTEAHNKLLNAKHAAVELVTGAGKSILAVKLTKSLGLKTVVAVPSINIANQMYNLFSTCFGTKYIGKFYSSKKECKKLITIAVAASLFRVEKGTKEWEEFSKVQTLIFDESHLVASNTLSHICLQLISNAPYRFFVSGTQMRGDGLDLLLQAITGKVVMEYDLAQAVKEGYLAKPIFNVIDTISESKFDGDINDMTRAHFYYNPNVNRLAGELANKYVEEGRTVLILIDELGQFSKLLSNFRHEAAFAHAGVTAANKKMVPEAYHKSDPTDLVNKLNNKEIKILVGTSCVSIGSNFTGVGAIIYLMAGRSEVNLRQCMGRGTRKVEGKEDFYFVDFNVTNIPALVRHANIRKSIYKELKID